MKKLKKIMLIILGIIIGISTTVGAATIFNSKDITYSSSATTKTNVKDSLNELYDLTTNYKFYKPLADQVKLGDYINIIPTSTNYTIPKSLTGHSNDQTINPSELNLWRVIKKNEDGTIDVLSNYLSAENVIFYGSVGYLNYVGTLNEIAAQYTDGKHVQSTRHFGYNGLINFCSSLSKCDGTEDRTGGDYQLVREALESKPMCKSDGECEQCWSARRYGSRTSLSAGLLAGSAEFNGFNLVDATEGARGVSLPILPILTIKSTSQIIGGDGKSAETAYTLE